jgi:5-methylcytosine-specific restriction protein B
MTNEFELKARRAKMEQVFARQAQDPARTAFLVTKNEQRKAHAVPGLEILDRFYRSGDVHALRDELQKWSQAPAFQAFGGVAGQMFLNQLVKSSPDTAELSRLLARCLVAPTTEAAAAQAIDDLAAYAESVKKGAQPAPRRAIFVLSFFWSLQNPSEWPCFWTSAERVLQRLGWLAPIDQFGALYLAYRQATLELGGADDVGWALEWLDEAKYSGLGPWVVERCASNLALNARSIGDAYASEGDERQAESNARAITGELKLLGEALADDVALALGRSLKMEVPSLFWRAKRYRGDGWVRWGIADDAGSPSASYRLWVTADGMFLGLHGGWYRNGWYSDAAEAMTKAAPEGARLFPLGLDAARVDTSTDTAPTTEGLFGWHYPEVISDADELQREIIKRAAMLQPVLDKLVALSGGVTTLRSQPEGDPLRELVQQFIAERSYPTAQDEGHKADRAVMAETLAPGEVQVMDIADLRRVYSTGRYASPGPQAVLNVTLRDATPAELQEYLDRIHFLLWGEGDDAARIDAMLDTNDKWIKGLGESGIMKLLAVVKPERYLPVYPYAGEQGKTKLIKALGLDLPPSGLTAGQRQVRANDIIRARLDPLFPNDPWGQAQFGYWLAQRPTKQVEEREADVLAALADDLLVSNEFIVEIVDLLRAKGQIIFYGPPGTGKTWVARALAKALAPDPTRRALVQFHPSTSYEDFFEGFRPEESGGQLSYQLRKGPLALMAERAESAPGITHVLVIDELNRANLPKVFGELLFLLEYRDEQVRTIYRPDDAFSLPENLLFVGTMNTADRSIALVDAALRRRFHFIPFFPDDGEMAGLLQRWLQREKQPTWVADLVEFVNAELVQELGGPDLQIGPSYFMTDNVEAKLPKIWKYNVEPLIQDQLFGQSSKIKAFSYAEVLKRFRGEQPADLEELDE